VRLLLGSLFALIVAAVVGLGATYLALTRGAAFGPLTIGSWTAWPKNGTTDADPYVRARFWTLTLYNTDGELVANSINRSGFTSQEIVRHADGAFEIVVAPRARGGNWLPTGGVERYILLLRLYDTAVGVSTKAGREVPMPSVTVKGCS